VNAVYGDPSHLQQGWTDIPYDLPNLSHREWPPRKRTSALAGYARGQTSITPLRFSVFTDELAHAVGRDPLDYLLDLIGKSAHY